jgi:hypothetical protein
MREKNVNASKLAAMSRGIAFREKNAVTRKSAVYIQAHARGLLTRILVRRMKEGVKKLQTNWRRFQAQLDVKVILYEKLETIRQKRAEVLQAMLEDKVACIIQRNFRRHRDYAKVVFMRREKGEADKRISTMLVALFGAASELRHFVHPWWRHLPSEIQEVLVLVKASMQRTIGLLPVTGKLANEELGKRGLRVQHSSHLHYDQAGKDPDLASHMLLSVTRHLLSHVPSELFKPTVTWACYNIGHQAVAMNSLGGSAKTVEWFPRDDIKVGKEMPPHPGDTLSTLWHDIGSINHYHDRIIVLPEESLPALILYKLPTHHRHVFLTAEVLVTMRQALDSPQISTDDHLKFQGLDASAGAQLMEVLGSELDHKLPLDWPKNYGTVAALAAQMSTHIQELVPEKMLKAGAKKEEKKPKSKAKAKPKEEDAPVAAKSKAKAKAKGAAGAAAAAAKKTAAADATEGVEPHEAGANSHFNRTATLRIVQQVGYLMRDQDKLLDSVLARGDDTGNKGPGGVRQSRYISVTDKLFDMADRAKHDHCSFVLAVVLYHMVLRGLFLRVLYHRAAMALQKKYRYIKEKGRKANMAGPAITIQRCWRGVRAALKAMRMDDAAYKIQQSYKAASYNARALELRKSADMLQRLWIGAIQRRWMQECHGAAAYIQKFVRGLQVRATLDKQGIALAKKFKAQLQELMQQKDQMEESTYLGKTAALVGRAKVAMNNHRTKGIDMRRMSTFTLRSKHTRSSDKEKKLKMKGAIQPARRSVFEPMTTALARLEPPSQFKNKGNSRILTQLMATKKNLDRTMPKEAVFAPHAAAKRGRAAIAARRFAKKPKEIKKLAVSEGPVDPVLCGKWAGKMFGLA